MHSQLLKFSKLVRPLQIPIVHPMLRLTTSTEFVLMLMTSFKFLST